MNKILVIFDCDNGLNHYDYDSKTWEEDEIYELPDDADPDVFVGILKIDTKKNYNKEKYGRKYLSSAYLISRVLY
jgi:hypothetical protein